MVMVVVMVVVVVVVWEVGVGTGPSPSTTPATLAATARHPELHLPFLAERGVVVGVAVTGARVTLTVPVPVIPTRA
jgi:hypothetical protein